MVIPSENIAASAVMVFISLFLPFVATSICLAGKFINAKAYACGFGVFLVSELMIRAPLISALLTDESFRNFAESSLGMVITGALSAGFIEETIKYTAADKLLKNDISYKTALSFGFGGICCEIIAVMGIECISNLITMIVINGNSAESIMSMPGASDVLDKINSITPVNMVFSLITRLSKASFCLAAAVLTMKGVQQKKPFYWFMCVILHSMFNCIMIFINNSYIACGASILFAVIFITFTFISKDEFTVRPASHRTYPSDRDRNRNKSKSRSSSHSSKNYGRNPSAINSKTMMDNLNSGGFGSHHAYPANPDSEFYSGQDIREIYKRNTYRK